MQAITKYYSELLIKELDTIQVSIKNLDDIIFKTKNFAFLIWGGSLYVISDKLHIADDMHIGQFFMLSAIIPILFWAMDYRWRKHILQSSKRMKIISLFLNSEEFVKFMSEEKLPPPGECFPVYDPVGWIYSIQSLAKDKTIRDDYFNRKYLIDEDEFNFFKVIFYKDACIFYLTLITLSFLLGFIMIN